MDLARRLLRRLLRLVRWRLYPRKAAITQRSPAPPLSSRTSSSPSASSTRFFHPLLPSASSIPLFGEITKNSNPNLKNKQFLVSYSERRRYGQAAPPQNHFTFYQTQNPYQPNATAYQQRQDGAWAEPPPLYHNTDAPPQYFAPPGATKANQNQGVGAGGVELPSYGVAGPQGGQQSGVVGAGEGASGSGPVDQAESSTQGLPPRPETAKTKLMGMVGRFRR